MSCCYLTSQDDIIFNYDFTTIDVKTDAACLSKYLNGTQVTDSLT